MHSAHSCATSEFAFDAKSSSLSRAFNNKIFSEFNNLYEESLTFAESIILFNLCSVSAGETTWVDPVNVAHCAGRTVQNSYRFILKDSRAPNSKAQISRWICRACTRRELEPPPHFADPLTCGPKKIASIGPGEVVPRQFNVPLLFHGFPLFGALSMNTNGFDK